YALGLSIQMYGFILLEKSDEITNEYIVSSMEKPDLLGDDFTEDYFISRFNEEKDSKLSVKAFLATEQRFPGIGNGVLQDILFNAQMHPAMKLRDFNDEEPYNLYNSIRITLGEMTRMGGRDTEKDLYGNKGGYVSIMSKNSVGAECPSCGGIIEKKSYMGGSVYFCPDCQRKG
ncbi:MAG: endonuclease VIII, partial [Clostridia bacterium]|nr:endonuclease VIII [Clostridia bacterium]